MPLIGWTPKARAVACGFSVAKYGAQQSTDPWQPRLRERRPHQRHRRSPATTATDTSTAIGPSFVQAWMQHLVGRYGTAANGGVRFYNLDNEPMLWSDTHRDVHPSADRATTRCAIAA